MLPSKPSRISASVGSGFSDEQVDGGQHHAGRAVPALQPVALLERGLHRVPATVGQALDGGDRAAVGLHGQHAAGLDAATVQQDGAGPAVGGVAAHRECRPGRACRAASARAAAGVRPRRCALDAVHIDVDPRHAEAPPIQVPPAASGTADASRRYGARMWTIVRRGRESDRSSSEPIPSDASGSRVTRVTGETAGGSGAVADQPGSSCRLSPASASPCGPASAPWRAGRGPVRGGLLPVDDLQPAERPRRVRASSDRHRRRVGPGRRGVCRLQLPNLLQRPHRPAAVHRLDRHDRLDLVIGHHAAAPRARPAGRPP